MSRIVKQLRERFFANQLKDWQRYHQLIEEKLHQARVVLDIGCGRGEIAPFGWERYPQIKRIGLDPDPTARSHPGLAAFHLLEIGAPWPIEENSIDLAVARYVLEHVEDPDDFFRQLQRVLRVGGSFVFLTPNRLHPAALASRALPTTIKRIILKRSADVDEDDVFPTHYKMNDGFALKQLADRYGFRIESLAIREYGPIGYLDFSLPTFSLACSYYLATRWTGAEKLIGATILGCIQKQAP